LCAAEMTRMDSNTDFFVMKPMATFHVYGRLAT